jgi:hypothetical protein
MRVMGTGGCVPETGTTALENRLKGGGGLRGDPMLTVGRGRGRCLMRDVSANAAPDQLCYRLFTTVGAKS